MANNSSVANVVSVVPELYHNVSGTLVKYLLSTEPRFIQPSRGNSSNNNLEEQLIINGPKIITETAGSTSTTITTEYRASGTSIDYYYTIRIYDNDDISQTVNVPTTTAVSNGDGTYTLSVTSTTVDVGYNYLPDYDMALTTELWYVDTNGAHTLVATKTSTNGTETIVNNLASY